MLTKDNCKKPFMAFVIPVGDPMVAENCGRFTSLAEAQVAIEARGDKCPSGYPTGTVWIVDLLGQRSYWAEIPAPKPRLKWIGGQDCGSVKS